MTFTASKLLQTPASNQWKQIGIRPHHGVDIPLFSLHSAQSCGIGEYPDLLPIVDWAAEVGLDVIQLLPLNDNGPESSPYSAISSFALNPLNLGLASLPHLDRMKSQVSELQNLTNTQRIDYPLIEEKRESFLREYFKTAGHLIAASPDYLSFLSRNPWLENYALFNALKIETKWQSWEEWKPEWRDPTPQSYQLLLKSYRDEIIYHSVIQFLCFQQLNAVKKRAESKGVLLKGDIPILINRESADVWRYRSNYRLDFTAGAPPDMYNKEGQKWGFPLYNWDVLEQNDFEAWKQRLQVAERLYHLYRLDHIVGFFRIWAIPIDKTAKEGFFLPAEKEKWLPKGEKILNMMLTNCAMLPIGEDLGTVPTEVRQALAKLGICGTKVMRWERMWEEDKRFIPVADYPVCSMTTVSTHDSDTLQLWWKNSPEDAQTFATFKGWTYTLDLSPEHQREILWDSHHSGSIFHINLLNEYLALIPNMTWPNPEDERINIPGLISDRNWTYRFRPSVEEITSNAPLADLMRNLIS